MWFGVAPRVDTLKGMCSREIAYSEYDNHSHLNRKHNWRKPTRPFNEHETLHFDNDYDVHMSSKTYEESGHGVDLDLLTVSC